MVAKAVAPAPHCQSPARVRETKCNAADPLRFRSWPELFLPRDAPKLGLGRRQKISTMKRRFAFLALACLALGSLTQVVAPAWAGGGGDDKNGGGGDDKNGGGDDDNSGDGGENEGTGGSGTGGGASLGSSSSNSGNNKDNDSDTAQNAVKRGEAVSLSTLLSFVRSTYDAAVINVELSKRGGRYYYRVKLLTSDSKLRIVDLDALKLTTPETASIY
jgi:hypothetical protein